MIATTLVGSYPQPDWLVDKTRYRQTVVPRILMPDVWRPPSALLEQAQDDAVRLAVHEMEGAGIAVLTDGEQRRESYFNQFANALAGIDVERPGEAINRLGKRQAVPRVTGPIRRERPIFLRDAQFLRAITARPIKIAVPGPFTLSALAQDEHYRDAETLAMAYAAAVNEELRALEPVVDWIQLDEPYLEAQVDRAHAYAVPAIDRALDGLHKPTCVHVCFGYAFSHALAGTSKSGGYAFALQLERSRATHVSLEAAQPRLDLGALEALPTKTVVLGVLDLGAAAVESADVVAARIEAALKHVPAERLVAAPDCGMKFLDRPTARGKLHALVEGARLAVA
jgi:5-methyltetrahydropteroyltriglutamate--homocysteine methyltransferase